MSDDEASASASSNDEEHNPSKDAWLDTGEHVGSTVRRYVVMEHPSTTVTNTNGNAPPGGGAAGGGAAGGNIIQVMEGQVVAMQKPNGRLPTLWKIHLVDTGLPNTTTTTTTNHHHHNNTYRKATPPSVIEIVTRDEVEQAQELALKRWNSCLSHNTPIVNYQETVGHYQHILEERCQDNLIHHISTTLLPTLCILACIEEALQQMLHDKEKEQLTMIRQQRQQLQTKKNGKYSKQPSQQPPYYYKPPSQYMSSAAVTATTEHSGDTTTTTTTTTRGDSPTTTTTTTTSGYTPSTIGSRIRQGAQLAYKYHSQFITPAADIRRSSRLPPPSKVAKPQVVQRGGRIALYLLGLLEQHHHQQQDDDDTTTKEPKGGEDDEDDNDHHHNNNNNNDDAPQEEEEEDEEEESEEEDESEEEEESDDDESDDDDDEEEEDVIINNPYLEPTPDIILDWLGRRGKNMTGIDIQQAICKTLKKDGSGGFSRNHLEPLDTRVLYHSHVLTDDQEGEEPQQQQQQEKGGHSSGSTQDTPSSSSLLKQQQQQQQQDHTIILHCTTGDKVRDLPHLEVTSFARCKFALQLVNPHYVKPPKLKRTKEERQLEKFRKQQELKVRLDQEKKMRSWANWRYKSIHGGHCLWPQWTTTLEEWWTTEQQQQQQQRKKSSGNSESKVTISTTTTTTTTTSTTSMSSSPSKQQQQQQSLQEKEEAQKDDATLARELQQAEGAAAAADDTTVAGVLLSSSSRSSRRRRTTRGGGGGSGQDSTMITDGVGGTTTVFYGAQSSMTQKQLLDAVYRLCCTAPQSLLGLNDTLKEETANPFQRLRTVMGKLVWKRNQVVQMVVSTIQSDGKVWKSCIHQKRPLVTTWAENEEAAAEQPSETTTNDTITTMDVVKQEDHVDGTTSSSLAAAAPQTEAITTSTKMMTTTTTTSSREDAQLTSLVEYLRSLHETELHLRRLVLECLTKTNTISTIAVAADERMGSLEALDSQYLMDNYSEIEWHDTGHPFLGQLIYRPPLSSNADGSSASAHEDPCQWYKVQEYTPSVEMPSRDDPQQHPQDPQPQQPPQSSSSSSSIGKEPREVERRMRFRVVSVSGPDEEEDNEDAIDGNTLMLTEGQVHAGMKAATMMAQEESLSSSSSIVNENPFCKHIGANVMLEPIRSGGDDNNTPKAQPSKTADGVIPCVVVGHDTVILHKTGKLQHKILILPETHTNSSAETTTTTMPESTSSNGNVDNAAAAFWATVSTDADGILMCQPINDDNDNDPKSTTMATKSYKIRQSEYHEDSRAFEECQAIIEFMKDHKNAEVFLEPVDPVALQIPDYFKVIQHPMDISTLESNLEKGVYSKPPTATSVGKSPAAKMLNGPFKEDAVRIFDNAMTFNPPDDWIHQAAAAFKKAVLKKIDQASKYVDNGGGSGSRGGRSKKKSVYMDEDSDVDMYEYESDRDDDYDGGGSSSRRNTKRKRGGRRGGGSSNAKEEPSTRAIESPIRLQTTLHEYNGLSGPFANLPIRLDPSTFTLSKDWTCVYKHTSSSEETTPPDQTTETHKKEDEEIAMLLALQREVEETERASLRRSTRSHTVDHVGGGGERHDNHTTTGRGSNLPNNVEYQWLVDHVQLLEAPPKDTTTTTTTIGEEEEEDTKGSSNDDDESTLTTGCHNRQELEIVRETLHENYYAKLFQKFQNNLVATDVYGFYTNGSFPPFMGRIVPLSSSSSSSHVQGGGGGEGGGKVMWEIRSSYTVTALRWVIRGLIQSGHLKDLEPLLVNDSPLSTGVILPNNAYHYHYKQQQQQHQQSKSNGTTTTTPTITPPPLSSEPFDILDLKEMLRRRKAANAGEASSDDSESDVELSEYEKLRAERVARNAERLKALGLA